MTRHPEKAKIYSSVSSFLSGPGVAWQKGFGWVYYASTQVVAAFIVLGVLGKKMAVIGRKTDSVTVVDVIRKRYGSDLLANFSAVNSNGYIRLLCTGTGISKISAPR